MSDKYDDMLHLPHHVSSRHLPMSSRDRAAQFSPFAALSGYEAALDESARVTQQKRELDEQEKERINAALIAIKENIAAHPVLNITHFVPDELKCGGSYAQTKATVKRIDEYGGFLVLTDGKRIALDDIIRIEPSE